MTTEPHDGGGSTIRVPIPEFVHEAVARAGRVLEFHEEYVFKRPAPPRDACWHAGQALLCVMRDQLAAARLHAEKCPYRPYPLMVSVRPIYEAMLQLFYLLRPDGAEERQALGGMFWAFHEWETIETIHRGPGGQASYEARLSDAEQPNLARRLDIASQAEVQFTPEQRRQLKRGRWNVTWTGQSIAQLAQELGREVSRETHTAWYGVMSMATHVTPGAIHWTYNKLLDRNNPEKLERHALRCLDQSTWWLDRGSIMVFLCSKVFLQRYEIDLSDAGRQLDREVLEVCKGSVDPAQEDIVLRNDPTIRDLVERVVQAVHPLRIILFGSAVRGEMRTNSDFDVLVVVPDGTPVGRAEDAMYRSMWGFPIAVDFIAATEEEVRKYGDNPNMVIHTALTEGKELYRAAG